MRNRQIKRWCEDCKMMVFALAHEHGREVESPQMITPMVLGQQAAVWARVGLSVYAAEFWLGSRKGRL